ncbi:LOW QUALITY PROTEIN: hypothetical protein U9M48_033931 [Paspalum notatum var. saurae]|uniref:Uncharacterized protein n=1 Tax=Paspalum notatum var. saurae TaxID=547442 RepID=A0AAQ3UBG5_PASNO
MAARLVDDGAVPADLPLRSGEHLHAAHLHHGRGEVGEELGGVGAGVGDGGLPLHVGPGGGVVHERLVGGEERPALGHVPVVAGVERPEAAGVHLHQRRPVAGVAAPALQPRDRLSRDGSAIIVPLKLYSRLAKDEQWEVPRNNLVLGIEALGDEELVQVPTGIKEGWRESSRIKISADSYQYNNVPCYQSQDISTGNHSRTGLLQLRFDTVDRAKPSQAEVRYSILLGGQSRSLTTAEAEDKVEGGLLLDVVVSKGAAFLKLLASEDEALLVRGDALLVLNLGLHILNCVGGLNLQGYGLAGEGLHEDLHLEHVIGS